MEVEPAFIIVEAGWAEPGFDLAFPIGDVTDSPVCGMVRVGAAY
jgi:hypothetical protein